MPDSITPEVVIGFRELLHEFRAVGDSLSAVVERTARLEEKVDRLVDERSAVSGLAARLTEVEGWFQAELAAKAARSVTRGLWIGATATVVGGGLGAVIAHYWK